MIFIIFIVAMILSGFSFFAFLALLFVDQIPLAPAVYIMTISCFVFAMIATFAATFPEEDQ